MFQSFFVNQHFVIDNISKLSYLDTILIYNNSKLNIAQTLYTSVLNDLVTETNTFFLPLSPLLHSEYQETFSTTFILAPELVNLFIDYITIYILPSTFNNSPSIVFDSYVNNLNYYTGEGVIYFLLFSLYV
jgi:hypothetical protein